jgi:hypothetical protein
MTVKITYDPVKRQKTLEERRLEPAQKLTHELKTDLFGCKITPK